MKQIANLVARRGFILESEISCIKSRANRGNFEDYEKLFAESYGVQISPEQTAKGLSFLLNLWKTPRGKERKNNPFGYREQAILDDFKEFQFVDIYNASRGYCPFYLPVYRVIANDGSAFEYYYNFEGLTITA